MKKYLKVILVPIIFLVLTPLLFSIINLFDIEIKKIFYLGMMIIMALIAGFFLGTITNSKAYLKGLALGSIMSLIMFLISILLRSKFSFYTLVYYAIIVVSSMMGSVMGITKKDK